MFPSFSRSDPIIMLTIGLQAKEGVVLHDDDDSRQGGRADELR